MSIINKWVFNGETKLLDWGRIIADGLGAETGDVIQLVDDNDGVLRFELNKRYAAEVHELAKKLMKELQKYLEFTDLGVGREAKFHSVDGVTVCEIRGYGSNRLVGCGVAFCEEDDTYDKVVGEALALSRALGVDDNKNFSYLEDFLWEREKK